jgi:hypothetical protein
VITSDLSAKTTSIHPGLFAAEGWEEVEALLFGSAEGEGAGL